MISLPGKHTLQFFLTKEWKAFFLFFGGFLFDILTLERVDDLLTLIQQFSFLLLASFILIFSLIRAEKNLQLSARFQLLWVYHDEAFHFLLGSLLSGYTIFYLKSASTFGALLFIVIMGSLLALNELPTFKKVQLPFKFGLLAWSWISFLLLAIPTIIGSIGIGSKLLSAFCFILLMGVIFLVLKNIQIKMEVIKSHLLIPFSICAFVFFQLLLYKILPPVPLSLKYIGIYRSIEKVDGLYHAHYNRSSWRFWEHGEQNLHITSDQKVYTFVKVFSPTSFQDKLLLEYYYKSPSRGWIQQDTISLTISGGRKEGFRGFSYKGIHSAGDWEVIVKTSDGSELGRIDFNISYQTDNDYPRVDIF